MPSLARLPLLLLSSPPRDALIGPSLHTPGNWQTAVGMHVTLPGHVAARWLGVVIVCLNLFACLPSSCHTSPPFHLFLCPTFARLASSSFHILVRSPLLSPPSPSRYRPLPGQPAQSSAVLRASNLSLPLPPSATPILCPSAPPSTRSVAVLPPSKRSRAVPPRVLDSLTSCFPPRVLDSLTSCSSLRPRLALDFPLLLSSTRSRAPSPPVIDAPSISHSSRRHLAVPRSHRSRVSTVYLSLATPSTCPNDGRTPAAYPPRSNYRFSNT
jgi:hypothetical protein